MDALAAHDRATLLAANAAHPAMDGGARRAALMAAVAAIGEEDAGLRARWHRTLQRYGDGAEASLPGYRPIG